MASLETYPLFELAKTDLISKCSRFLNILILDARVRNGVWEFKITDSFVSFKTILDYVRNGQNTNNL